MFWDDLDDIMHKIIAEMFCEASIAIPLKKRHNIYVNNVLKNDVRRRNTTKPIYNRKVIKPKGTGRKAFLFRKNYIRYNERTT